MYQKLLLAVLLVLLFLLLNKGCGCAGSSAEGLIDYWASVDKSYDPSLSGWDMDESSSVKWRPWSSNKPIIDASTGPNLYGNIPVLYAKTGSRGERENVLLRSAPGDNSPLEGFGQQRYLHELSLKQKNKPIAAGSKLTPELFKKLERKNIIYSPGWNKAIETVPNDLLANTPKVPVVRYNYGAEPGTSSIETPPFTEDFLHPDDSNFMIRTL